MPESTDVTKLERHRTHRLSMKLIFLKHTHPLINNRHVGYHMDTRDFVILSIPKLRDGMHMRLREIRESSHPSYLPESQDTSMG